MRMIPNGSFVDNELGVYLSVKVKHEGYLHNVRPTPYRSFSARLQMAWDVLRYRADALYWSADLAKLPPHAYRPEEEK